MTVFSGRRLPFQRAQCRWLALWLLLGAGPLSADLLADAQACTGERDRLVRLACFDRAFDTPVGLAAGAGPALEGTERWRQAFAQALDADRVIYRDTGAAAGLLVTVPALGAAPPRPLLTVQCQGNITELALMVPEPVAAERVTISLAGAAGQWRVRDNGRVISSGRGLPSIRLAKALTRRDRITLRSSEPSLDGRLFDLEGFGRSLGPLRDTCGW